MVGSKKGSGNVVASRRKQTVKVKTARRRTTSSNRWLQRQLNDPYVAAAKTEGYRSRAAFKILELDEKFHFFKQGMRVVDLGAAPGGWSQIASTRMGKNGKIVAIDLLPIDPIAGAEILEMDFLDDEAPEILKSKLGGEADIVMSDMAPSTTGHKATDHLRIIGLAENAAYFAKEILKPGGSFVCKLFQGGETKDLILDLKKCFTKVRHAKPSSSRADSSEIFLVATGFKGDRPET